MEEGTKTVPYRASLHTLLDLLADFGAFEGRTVAIIVKNGRDLSLVYDPPLDAVIAKEIGIRSVPILANKENPIVPAIDEPDDARSIVAEREV